MKKILIFITILIVGISCSNAGKTGTNYGNSNSGNGNNSGNTGKTVTSEQEKKNKEWISKVAGKNIQNSKVKYKFDTSANIIVNDDLRYYFVKYLGDNKAIYYEEADPSDKLFDEVSEQRTKFYSLLYVTGSNDEVNFIDGYKDANWKEDYKNRVYDFHNKNQHNPKAADWSQYPHMEDTDLNINKKGDPWGFLKIDE